MKGFYNAIDIAQYVINYAINKKQPVTNLKLQKLLYYIQAAFLIEEGKPCFKENILNWRHGPVVKEVYDEYKDYVDSKINDYQNGYYRIYFDEVDLKVKSKFFEFNPGVISLQHQRLINKVVDKFFKFNAWEMVKKIKTEKQWEGDIIENKEIREFFIDNKTRIEFI